MKKKITLTICIILILSLGLFVLTGCGNKKEEANPADTQTIQTGEATSNEEENVSKNEASNYTYKDGVLTQIVDEKGNPKQTDFVIDGIILVGNRHSDYSIESLLVDGYKTTDINSSFYLNEQIEFYLDTKYSGKESDVNILVTPHDTIENYEKMSFSEILDIAQEKGFYIDYRTPEKDNYNYIGNGYVSLDYPKGKYDILFLYKGKLAYFINIDLTDELVE